MSQYFFCCSVSSSCIVLKDTLLLKKAYQLIGSPQVFGNLFCEPVPVYRRNVLDLVAKILFHPLDFNRGMLQYQESNVFPQIATIFCLL
jgi:hypothetical protein